MPTVLRIGGYRVVIYTNDHRPAHVHVMDDGREAVFILHCPKGPPVLRENMGFRRHELNSLVSELATELKILCKKWSEIHGKHN